MNFIYLHRVVTRIAHYYNGKFYSYIDSTTTTIDSINSTIVITENSTNKF